MVRGMCSRAHRSRFPSVALTLLLVATGACGKKMAVDPNNREIPWTYGPTNGGASAEHVRGTGKEGGAAIAKGWQCRLLDGKRFTVRAYQLAADHPLFGKVVLGIGLFDKNGKELTTVVTTPVTAQNASFTFELADTVGSQLLDAVIWYRKA